MYVTELDWNRFFALAVLRRGFDFRLYRPHQLRRRIISFMELRNLHSLPELWSYLNNDDDKYIDFLSKLSINVSEFFRDVERWKQLQDKILPEILLESPEIQAWSVGCSYGAEVYSLAMILEAHFPGKHSILGTDISSSVLEQAREGIFSSEDLQHLPQKYKETYFKHKDEKWTILPKLKQNVQFVSKDVFAEEYEKKFHLIICRNLAIYLTREAQYKLHQILYHALMPGGYLFIGSTERVAKSEEIGFENTMPFFYKKPTQEATSCKNVS